MCTISKWTFGCGHCLKAIDNCGLPNCEIVDKWKFSKQMDCNRCRAAGTSNTRGRDGYGRYGRGIARNRDSRHSSSDSLSPSNASPSSTNSPHMSVSPWAPNERSRKLEKPWTTPTRQMADKAWMKEHEGRMSDLDERTSKMSLSSSRDSIPIPRESYERFIDVAEVEEPEEIEEPPNSQMLLAYETTEESDTPHSSRRSRTVSYDVSKAIPVRSPTSMPRTPRRKTYPVPAVSQRGFFDTHNTKHKYRRHELKIEPYQSQSSYYESPIGSPVIGQWIDHYEIIQPMQEYETYPPWIQVY